MDEKLNIDSDAPAVDRRQAARQTVSCQVEIDLANSLPLCHGMTVRVVDISTTGVGITSAVPLVPGHNFILNLAGGVTGLLYHVVRCETTPGGGYLIGAEFVCALTASDHGDQTSLLPDEQAIEQLRRMVMAEAA